MLRLRFPSRSGSRSATPAPSLPPIPVPSNSSSRSSSPMPSSSYLSPASDPSPSSSSSCTPGSSRSLSPFSLCDYLSPKPLPRLPAPGPAPGPAASPTPEGKKADETTSKANPNPIQAQLKSGSTSSGRKISTTRLHQLTTLLTILNLTKGSLQKEQESMADILQAAHSHKRPRTSSPDSRDIDLLALASNACRARRYRRGTEPTGLNGKSHWQGVVDELGRTIERLEKEVEGLERERKVLEGSW